MTTERLTFATKAGDEVQGELALPSGEGRAPAVVLLQEFWGVNDHIRSLATRLAQAGFVVVAPDLYHGVVARDREQAAQMMKDLDWPRALGEIGAAAAFLEIGRNALRARTAAAAKKSGAAS